MGRFFSSLGYFSLSWVSCQPTHPSTYPRDLLPTYLPNYLTNKQTNKQTLWSSVLRKKLIVTQLLKKLPTFFGTRRFITVFTKTNHLSLSWARCIQSTSSHPVSWTSVRSIKCLSKHDAVKTYWGWKYSATHSWPRH